MLRSHFRIAASLLILLGLCFGGAGAQDPASTAPAKPATAKDRRPPLPTYYGQIGVSNEQREQLLTVQEEYEMKLEALREQLKKLVQERDAKMEGLLTPGQKLRMKELQEEAKTRAAKKPQPES